ncbi:multiple sugar transport system permease protein/N-acetylglucosamine transport system permease protein [Crossiella equi]|uniref:Multiple sugar transport system permease protein/N-acetylglucosamine transport system permease protein n=1 Tax=Crossiella equi TaxID=130796 RepID=A0ABS5AQN4_9PSEU|nr:carbohydrate ABC transporter permease [Crossiella equi]MBP2478746.1 multiple sugar transport system permease protein/N-acetylglucosamine transport system permease protein [Crossiella equi]
MTSSVIEETAPKAKRERQPLRAAGLGLVWLLVAFNVGVLLWMLLAALREHTAIFANPWGLDSFGAVGNFVRAWVDSDFGGAALNTILVVASASVVVTLICAPASYVLSKTRSRLSGGMSVFFAMGIGIPVQVIVIPLFVLMQELGLVDSLFGLFVLYVALSVPFTVFLLTGFFGSLPDEIEEAAAIDGAGSLRTFALIVLPLARNGLLTALMLNVIGLWNETFIAMVFVQTTDKYTLSLSLLGFMQTQQYSGLDYGTLFAGVSILVLPMVLVYVWLGRRIIEGLTVGAVK